MEGRRQANGRGLGVTGSFTTLRVLLILLVRLSLLLLLSALQCPNTTQ